MQVIALTGRIYRMETREFDKKGTQGEKGTLTTFGLGVAKDYTVKKVIDGVEKQVRENVFFNCKAFNGLGDTIFEHFKPDAEGNQTKRRIQVVGVLEENKYTVNQKVKVNIDGKEVTLEIPVEKKDYDFIVRSFGFVDDAPEGTRKSTDGVVVATVVTEESSAEDQVAVTTEGDATPAGSDEDVPF